jgi:hypothetical protein
VRTVPVTVWLNPEFSLSHDFTVATLLPRKQVKLRENGFLYVRMSMTGKRTESGNSTYENMVSEWENRRWRKSNRSG